MYELKWNFQESSSIVLLRFSKSFRAAWTLSVIRIKVGRPVKGNWICTGKKKSYKGLN